MRVSEIHVKQIRVNQELGVKYVQRQSFSKYIGILYLVRVGQYLEKPLC